MLVVLLRVVVNCGAGSVDGDEIDAQRQEISEAFAAAGAGTEIAFVPGPALDRALTEAVEARPDAVVVAGGDGTLGAAAAVLAGGDVPLGVMPLGTFNHFAKDLGMPLEMAEAAQAIVAGEVQRIDVAEVNGRSFLNNSSIGVYPILVARRDDIRRRRGWGKVRAAPVAAWQVLRRFPSRRLTVTAGTYRCRSRTPFVFVGNNRYEIGPSGVGERASITDGELCIYVARASSRWRLLRMAVSAVVGGAAKVPDLDEHCCDEVTIDAHGHRVQVALDGEVMTMRSPLRYRIRPASLPVLLTPAAMPPGAGSAAPTDPAGVDADPVH